MSDIVIDVCESDVLSKFDPRNALADYYRLLEKENEAINLFARSGKVSLSRLAAESLLPFFLLAQGEASCVSRETSPRQLSGQVKRYLDVGSGGGMPAIPFLITHEVESATLVERTQKKTVALDRMIVALNIEARIVSKNLDECRFNKLFDLVTVRQIRLTPHLLKAICRLLTPNGLLVYYSSLQSDFTQKTRYRTYLYRFDNRLPEKAFTLISLAN
ncbi:MAG: RsmG family class I SAM-dependent methyltransferase [Candidatus Zixiibacteriota bacterium]